MRASTSLSVFPDVNVWLALSYDAHVHHVVARAWYASLGTGDRIYFGRFTQLGLLRLLTNQTIMQGEPLAQRAAWEVYDGWLRDRRVEFLFEPPGLEAVFRPRTQASAASTKGWADGYLAAFADCTGSVLVTFDQALSGRATGSLVLGPSN